MGSGTNVPLIRLCWLQIFLSEIGSEGAVVVLATGEAAVDDAHQFRLRTEAELVIGNAVDVVMKHVLDALFGQSEARQKFIVGSQRGLKLHGHTGQHGINALLVHLSKTQAALLQKQVAGMFAIVQVVGIVYNTFDVAFIVAHLHPGLENILIIHNRVQR